MDMQTAAMTITPVQGTLMGALLMVVWKLLDVAKQLFLSNKVTPPTVTGFACQQDPKYGERLRRIDSRVKEIHDHTEEVELKTARGEFSCQWRDRDEVNKFINVSERQVEVMGTMVDEMKLLRQELILTRNGNGKT